MTDTDVQQKKLGHILRDARDAKGLMLDQVAAQLRIRSVYLNALELSDYDALPTKAHAKGFLRSYVQYLGLGKDLPDILALYDQENGVVEAPTLSMPTPLQEGKVPTLRLMMAAILAGIIVYFVWYGYVDTEVQPVAPPQPVVMDAPVVEPTPVEVVTEAPNAEEQAAQETAPEADAETAEVTVPDAAPAVETPAAEAPAAEPAPVVAPAAAPIVAPAPKPVAKPAPKPVAPKPAAAPKVEPAVAPVVVPPVAPAIETAPIAPQPNITVRAVDEAWVQVQDGMGATIYSRLLRPGDEYVVPKQHGLVLTTGNGAGIVLIKDGEASAPVGGRAEVVRNIRLTPNS